MLTLEVCDLRCLGGVLAATVFTLRLTFDTASAFPRIAYSSQTLWHVGPSCSHVGFTVGQAS